MIVDSIAGFERYLKFHPRFEAAYHYLRQTDLMSLEPGSYPINDDELYCNIYEGPCRPLEEAPLEVHDSYIDIQVVLAGVEIFGWCDRSRCEAKDVNYDASEDIAYLKDKPEVYISMSPGQLVVFFPHDAHAPLIGGDSVKKAVIKVRL